MLGATNDFAGIEGHGLTDTVSPNLENFGARLAAFFQIFEQELTEQLCAIYGQHAQPASGLRDQ